MGQFQAMRVIRHFLRGEPPFRRPAVALGNFDGIHLGHRKIVERTIAHAAAAGGDAVVFTFWPHPVAVLAPERAPAMLTSLARRLRVLGELGIGGVVAQRFTQGFAAQSPADFVRSVLVDGLGVSAVVVGYNVTFGHDRAGTPEVLQDLGRIHRFAVEVVGPVQVDGLQVSSSALRRLIAAGDVAGAAHILGRPHRLIGRVRRGERRGAGLGFPTANLLPRGGMLPPDGVYAVRAGVGSEEPLRAAVANLGSNPTFGGVSRRLEVHLLDYEGDLYGRRLSVDLVGRLRGEVRFDSVDALRRQIGDDAEQARRLLGARS